MLQAENIPSTDRLFYRIHENQLGPNKKIVPGCFRQIGEGDSRSMSTDWEKYSTVQESLQRAKDPEKNSIVSFVKNDLNNKEFDVRHSPIAENRAHTDVIWDESTKTLKTKFRAILNMIYTIET